MRFGRDHCLAAAVEDRRCDSACLIEDKDFAARSDGNYWTVNWYWKTEKPPVLKNTVSCYDKQLAGNKREEFEKEIERWIDEGVLLPWEEKVENGIPAINGN